MIFPSRGTAGRVCTVFHFVTSDARHGTCVGGGETTLEPLQFASCPLLNVVTHHIKRRMQDAASQPAVRRGQFVAEVGFVIGECAKSTGMLDDFGATWLLVKMLSAQCEQAWQRMIVGWIASQLVRGLLVVFSSKETTSGVPNLLRIRRSVLQLRCPCFVVVPHNPSHAYANVVHTLAVSFDILGDAVVAHGTLDRYKTAGPLLGPRTLV